MPNHVTNKLTIYGDENKIKECLSAIKGVWIDYPRENNRRIDFNKIIPMPEEIKIRNRLIEMKNRLKNLLKNMAMLIGMIGR